MALAFAGGLTHRSTREAMPAREVERPLVVPSGWTVVSGAVGESGAQGAFRTSVSDGAELRAAGALAAPWTVGGSLLLGRQEAPAASASLDVDWTSPYEDVGHGIWTGLSIRGQWGGLRATASPLAGIEATGGWQAAIGAQGEVLLQAGPLGGRLEADIRWFVVDLRGGWRSEGFVQLNRAIRVGVSGGADQGLMGILELAL